MKENWTMHFKFNSKKIVSSALAFTMLSTAVISSDSLPLKKLIPTTAISASAAYSYGSWEYEILSRYTIRLTKYTGSSSYVYIPESLNGRTVKELGNGIFADNSTIRTVSIPRGITAIPDEAFIRCDNLRTVNLPPTIKTIGFEAFRGTGIESIYLPNSLVTLGDGAFYLCSNLKTVNIPSCETIEDHAFMRCPKLTELTFPSNLKRLGKEIFIYSPVTSVTLTNTNTRNFSTDYMALYGSDTLTNINVPNADIFGILLRDRALARCTELKNVNGSPLVQFTSSRFGPYTQPYIRSDYFAQIQKYFEKVDEDRIGFFERYFDAELGYIVMDVAGSCRTEGQTIKALHDWLCKKVDYDWNPDGTENNSIYNHVDSSAFMRNKTICDGYARALKLLFDKAGIESYFTHSSSHAWVIVKCGDYYFHLDACHDDDPNGTVYDHFLKSDADIRRCEHGHVDWETSNATNQNYPASRIKSGYIYGTPTCFYSLGDANRDGKVDSYDAELMEGIINGRPKSKYFDGTLADADLDGEITMNDVKAIREIAAQYK